MILEGTTSSGAVVPVQVTTDGKVVAEGRTGPQGPEGPQGPPGPDSSVWDRNGTVVSPTNDGDSLELTSGGTAGVSLDPGTTGSPLVRDSSGNVAIGSANTFNSRLRVHGDDVEAVFRDTSAYDTASGPQIKFQGNVQNGSIADLGYAQVRPVGANSAQLEFGCAVNGTVARRAAISGDGHFLVGSDAANPAVSLDPGSTGVPLVRDSVGRLLVGIANAPGGTLAGDVVCRGAVVLQSPNGMWWAIEVQDDGTLFASQTSIR